MVFRVGFIILLSTIIFSFDLPVSLNALKVLRAYEYSTLSLEIKLDKELTIAGILPPESEKIIIKPSSNSIISIENGEKISKFEFILLPKEKGIYNLKPFKILYFEGEPKEEDPKTFEYNIGEIKVKGRYFYKNLYFWYISGFIFLLFLTFFIIYFRRQYGKRNSPN